MKTPAKNLLILLLTAATVLLGGCHLNGIGKFELENGRLTELKDSESYMMSGSCYFVADRIESAAEFRQRTDIEKVTIPGGLESSTRYGTYLIELPAADGDYYLMIPEIHAAYEAVWEDENGNKTEWKVGRASMNKEDYTPQYLPQIVRIPVTGVKSSILIFVSDFNTLSPGILESPLISRGDGVYDYLKSKDMLTAASFAAFLIIGIFNLLLVKQNKNFEASLYFGFFALIVALRVLLVDRFAWQIFEQPSEFVYGLLMRLEMLTFYISPPLIYLTLSKLFPNEVSSKLLKAVLIILAVFSAVLLLPTWIYLRTRIFYQLYTLVFCSYLVAMVVRAAAAGRPGAVLAAGAAGIGLLAILNDILLSQNLIRSIYLSRYGLMFFIFAQTTIIALYYKRIRIILEKTNLIYSHFVPKELISNLGIDDILEIELGLGAEKEMSVLFADIRSYTELSEKMSPTENYRFLNSYLECVVPVIRAKGGIIDKFIGDGIMALFPGPAEASVDAARGMLKSLSEFNSQRSEQGLPEVKIGIGLHTGKVILGTLGESERMDVTVISDTVNAASRISDITKEVSGDILISGQTRDLLPRRYKDETEYLGEFKVRGKESLLKIYCAEEKI